MDLNTFQNNLKSIDTWDVLVRIIERNLHHIERLNEEQLRQGVRSTGGSTPSHSGSKKSMLYVDNKIDRGVYDESIYPSMNFYDTGKFYEGLKAKIDYEDGIYIESSDWKAEMLEENYGSNLYGLTDTSLEEFIDIIIDDFTRAIYDEILKD